MLLTLTVKKKTLSVGIRVYLSGNASFTEQRTAFTRAQNGIVQSRNFDLRVERARKIPYSGS